MHLKRLFLRLIPALLFLLLVSGGEIVLRYSPYPALLKFQHRQYSTVITDRTGRPLRIEPVSQGLRREFVSLAEVPPAVRRVFVKSEDKRFFYHRGVDGIAVIRGLLQNLQAGRVVSGSSTITMQLAALIHPGRKGVVGKMREAFDAMRLEARFSKPEILEMWLNALPFGRQAEGIQSAGRTYFSKPVQELTPAQAVVLAGIPRQPVKYNPVEAPGPAYAAGLRNAAAIGIPLTPGEVREAVRSASYGSHVFAAPNFLLQLDKRKRQSGEDADPAAAGQAETAENRVIRTSLDLGLQNYLHEQLEASLEKYRKSRITSAAGIVFSNRTGEVLAYVGSTAFFGPGETAQIDGVQVENQTGSCIKPFLYALAIEKGYLPNDILPDIPMDFGGREIYVPMNFDNRFHGPVRLRPALASSLNVPAVYLLHQLGLGEFGDFLTRLGFSDIQRKTENAGLGAALGNIKISLFELTKTFAVFPRNGLPLHPVWYAGGTKAGNSRDPVITPYTAGTICSILSDPAARITGFGTSNMFRTSFPSMFKTGTSDQYQNIWALAATPDYTVGIWMGNLRGATVIGRTGSSVPAYVAKRVLEKLQKHPAAFPAPAPAKEVVVCALSGKRAGPDCPARIREFIPPGRNIMPCDFHVRSGGELTVIYPSLYGGWLRQYGREGSVSAGQDKTVRILRPAEGSVFYLDPGTAESDQMIAVKAVCPEGGCSLFVNGSLIKSLSGPPYDWYLPVRPGHWNIEVRADGTSDSAEIEVR